MARRIKHRRRTDTGAAWISYSDMMAALLLLFVLVLCCSIYQYFVMLETKTTEIEEKAKLVTTQGNTILLQEGTIQEQTSQLFMQKEELQDRQAQIDMAGMELTESQTLLATQQTDLDDANYLLGFREDQLRMSEEKNKSTQHLLDDSTRLLGVQQQALTTQQQRLDDLVGVKTRIIRDLSQALSAANLKATVDPATGDIVLESTVFFDVGKNDIKDSGKELLNTFIPVYLSVLLSPEYADYLGEIIIEGHTDTSGSYLMNLELSQERALSVATYCLEMPGLTDEQRDLLRTILTAKGRSFANPILDENGNVDMDASRRVEFKFSLKDSEMIEEIRVILGEQSGVEMPMELPGSETETTEVSGGGEMNTLDNSGKE